MSGMKLIIFDLDGTLVNSFLDIATSVNKTLEYFGYPLLDERIVVQYIGDGIKKLVARSFGKSVFGDHSYNWPEEKLEEYYRKYLEFYSANLLETTRLYPGVQDVLKNLNGYVKVILSNKNKVFTDRIIQALEIKDYFDFVYGGDSFSVRKPDPTPIIHILNTTRVSPALAVIVGDSEKDIIAGKRAGIKTCAVTYGLRSYDELQRENPDAIIDDIRDLPAVIENFFDPQGELSSPGQDR